MAVGTARLRGKVACVPSMIARGQGGAIVCDEARAITGVALPVDGGQLARG